MLVQHIFHTFFARITWWKITAKPHKMVHFENKFWKIDIAISTFFKLKNLHFLVFNFRMQKKIIQQMAILFFENLWKCDSKITRKRFLQAVNLDSTFPKKTHSEKNTTIWTFYGKTHSIDKISQWNPKNRGI